MSGIASIILVIHLLITLALIGVVLLQRSEGGALGIGGGSGSFLSAAGAGNALTRATMILAAIFFGTSVLLSVLSRSETRTLNLGKPAAPVTAPQPVGPGQPGGPVSLPPAGGGGATAPATTPPANSSPTPQPVTPPKP